MTNETDILDDLGRIRAEALREIKDAADRKALEAIRIKHLARKAPLTGILRGLKELAPEIRAQVGQAANTAKRELESALQEKERSLSRGTAVPGLDPTLPGLRPPEGGSHLLTQTEDHILRIFLGMGFSVARGREVEDDYHNFEALNLPKGHPARDELRDMYRRCGH